MAARNLIILSAILFLLITAPAQAGKTYVWTDENGVTQITDTPPPAKVRQTTKVQSKNVDAVPSRDADGDLIDAVKNVSREISDAPERCGIKEIDWRKKYLTIQAKKGENESELEQYTMKCKSERPSYTHIQPFSCEHVVTLEGRYKTLGRVYDDLEIKAADCAVPLGWRTQMNFTKSWIEQLNAKR